VVTSTENQIPNPMALLKILGQSTNFVPRPIFRPAASGFLG